MLALNSARPTQNGFSILEAMIAVVIVIVAMTMGMPSIVEWMQNAQIRTAAESVLNGFQNARAEAVRRNATVEFTLVSPGSAGNTGWQTSLVAGGTVLHSKPAGEGSKNAVITTSPANSVAYTFSGFGRAPSNGVNADGSGLLTQVNITSGNTPPSGVTWRNLQIRITTGGDIRMCDPNVTNTSDPRSC